MKKFGPMILCHEKIWTNDTVPAHGHPGSYLQFMNINLARYPEYFIFVIPSSIDVKVSLITKPFPAKQM
jgi:hypothetical protein